MESLEVTDHSYNTQVSRFLSYQVCSCRYILRYTYGSLGFVVVALFMSLMVELPNVGHISTESHTRHHLDDCEYFGEWHDGQRHGKGMMRYANDDIGTAQGCGFGR
jgi:hypothetical protein